MAYTFKTNIAHGSNYGNKRDKNKIEYIVIHYTANDGDTDEANGKYFNGANRNASAHYFIDDDSITQSVPDDYVAWSVGGKKYASCCTTGGGKYYGKCTNTNSLNIEICDDVKNGNIYPSAATIKNAIEFTKKKMKEYNIPQERVIRHFDVVGKLCPAYWVDNAKWKTEFWNKLAEVKEEVRQEQPEETTPFLIKVDSEKVGKGEVLNIRKEPNATATIVGGLWYDDKLTYTIVDTENGWGKLKSGIGWINLYYTKAAATKPVYTIHTVKHGDTLWKIAQKYLGDGNRHPEIKKLNNLSSNLLYTGQELKIPNK